MASLRMGARSGWSAGQCKVAVTISTAWPRANLGFRPAQALSQFLSLVLAKSLSMAS
jgi:hypothetical protein